MACAKRANPCSDEGYRWYRCHGFMDAVQYLLLIARVLVFAACVLAFSFVRFSASTVAVSASSAKRVEQE